MSLAKLKEMIKPVTSTMVVMAGEATTAGSCLSVLARMGSAAPRMVEVVTCTVSAQATMSAS